MVFITANASKGGIHRYVAGKCSGVNCWRRGNTRGGGEIAGREAAHGEDFQGKKQQEESAEGAVG